MNGEAVRTTLPDPQSEADIVRCALAVLQARLPLQWTATGDYDVQRGDRRIDALIELTSPAAETITLVVECERSVCRLP